MQSSPTVPNLLFDSWPCRDGWTPYVIECAEDVRYPDPEQAIYDWGAGRVQSKDREAARYGHRAKRKLQSRKANKAAGKARRKGKK